MFTLGINNKGETYKMAKQADATTSKTALKKEQAILKNENLDVNEILINNARLENEMSELKMMLQQVIQAQTTMNSSNVVSASEVHLKEELGLSEEDYSIIPPNKLIRLTSLFYGGMTLRGSNNKPIRFDKFGMTRPVSFDDLTYICTNHPTLAEDGAFFIHDKEAVRALYLENSYTKIIDSKKMENLFDLSRDQIEDIVCSLNDTQMNTVENIVIQGIIDGNSKYSNWSKVDVVNKYCKKNLQKIAQDRMES